MTGPARVLVRVDAGAQVGLGHLQRCLALAGALEERGLTCDFLTNDEATAHVRRFGREGRSRGIGPSWGEEDLRETIAVAASRGSRVIVVDAGPEGGAFLHGLRADEWVVCAIDDLAPHPFPCEVVVNGDLHAQGLGYRSSSGETRFLLGPRYALLRREFWEVPMRMIRDVPRHVLVMLGGADPFNLMPPLIGELGGLPDEFSLTVVIGPFMARRAEIQAAADAAGRPVRVVDAPTSVCDLMQEADLAVSGAGQTLYELSRVGCPTIALQMADNQAQQLRAFAREGCVVEAGRAGDSGLPGSVGAAAQRLLRDTPRREAMSGAGRRLVDGRGACRTAEVLAQMARDAGEGLEATRSTGPARGNV